jgi:hypothetical protein
MMAGVRPGHSVWCARGFSTSSLRRELQRSA